MKYVILQKEDALGLQKAVQAHLENGWELSGGVSVSVCEYRWRDHQEYAQEERVSVYAQAMVNHDLD